MSEEDPTKDLTAVEMLRLLLADVRDMKTRLGAVETGLSTLQSTLDDRLKDTRPIWQGINARTERIEEILLQMRDLLKELTYSDFELKSQQARLSQRVSNIEDRTARD